MSYLIFIYATFLIGLLIPKFAVLFRKNDVDIWSKKLPHWLARMFYGGVRNFAKFWHRYEVHGLENITGGNCLLVGYHSRATIDGVYASSFIEPTTIMSPIFFAVPFSTEMLAKIHCVSSHRKGVSTEDAFVEYVVHGERPVMLFPGGHHECYKRLSEKYHVNWKENPGFARILLSEPKRPGQHTKVIPFFTNNCEEIFPTTDWWYDYAGQSIVKYFHDFENGAYWMLPVLMPMSLIAIGFILIQRPLKLDLYFGEPVTPLENENSVQFAKRVSEATQRLIDKVRKLHSSSTTQDRTIETVFLTHPFYSFYLLFQNLVMWTTFISLNLTVAPIVFIGSKLMKKIFGKSSHNHDENNKKDN